MIIWNFSTDKAYNAGDFCIYSGKLYKASVDVAAGAWDSSKWELIKTFQAAISVVTHDIADFWNSATSYSPGDYCIYSNSLYKCLDSTTSAWDSTTWEQVNVMSQIRSGGGGGISADVIAAAFDSTASYSSGDYVMYNDEFYILLDYDLFFLLGDKPAQFFHVSLFLFENAIIYFLLLQYNQLFHFQVMEQTILILF